ncbi:MAG TPA: methyltransferase domain-containing protein [Ktedonobacteraceae bacterium]|nr:methyltransferase domain-containing protein [Ktedonobacteraceae bacterium]
MPAEPQQNAYFIDAESAAEMGRLIRLDEIATEGMGGLFPDHPDLSSVQSALDVACGPGGWASELAYQYPGMQVVGIDISQTMVRYAEELARVQRLDNVRFLNMDATQPLDFPDNSFDLVNARALFGFMRKQQWPQVVREFVRVCKPGGIVRLSEPENTGMTNSPALEKLNRLFMRALFVNGQSFAPLPESQYLCLTSMLETFLREAGCQDIHEEAYVINFSAGAKANWSFTENHKVAYKLLQPFMIKAGVATQEELDTLYEQMLAEMLADNFRGLGYGLSVWGKKPV